MKNFTLILYGFPASGKGTQGRILQHKLAANYFSSGDLIRKIKEENNRLGQEVKKRYDQGIPQPDRIITRVFIKKVQDIVEQSGPKRFIFDGYPKSINQANALEEICQKLSLELPYFFYIKISAKSALKRISSRLFCPKCNKSYLPKDKEYKSKSCSCGGHLTIRDDDKPAVVKNRLKKEKIIITKLEKYYKSKQRFFSINGEASVNKVSQSILQLLKKRYK